MSDGLLVVNQAVRSPVAAARFLNIATRLPLELQMMLCYRAVGSGRVIIHRNCCEQGPRQADMSNG